MANRTDPVAVSIHGTNPQFLISKIIRDKIINDVYWKDDCFGLTAESIIDKAILLKYIGSTSGRKASPFICLLLKLLQIQPSLVIVLEYIKQEKYPYLRALAFLYLRLTAAPEYIYVILENYFYDYRKLRLLLANGKFKIIHMDEYIESLLYEATFLDIDLPVLVARFVLEEPGRLESYSSALD